MTPSNLEKTLIERAKAKNPAFRDFSWSVSDVRFTNKLGKDVMAVDLCASAKNTVAYVHLDIGMGDLL